MDYLIWNYLRYFIYSVSKKISTSKISIHIVSGSKKSGYRVSGNIEKLQDLHNKKLRMPPLKYSSITALEKNPLNVYLDSTEVLIRIARNVLKDPSNPKFRSLSLKSSVVTTKLLPTVGAMECLFDMGFQEGEDNLILSQQAPLSSVKYIHDELTKRRELRSLNQSQSMSNKTESSKSSEMASALIAIQNQQTNSFLKKAVFWCFFVLKYDDIRLKKKALSLIPLTELNLNVMKCIRNIQMEFKKKNIKEEKIDYQELLLRELCNWFNGEFFTWVDTPRCTNCGFIETVHEGVSYEVIPGADRVEKYKCQKCQGVVLFPRFNDPEKLLETRQGRCGEWANCFCLFCHALGWDTRLIFDETDHVWVEVYSLIKSKWMHCDPCENAVDTPLMYECGWKKKLSYIIAYSLDEIQDVTWRYSQNHAGLLKNRTKCSEQELINFIINVRNTMLNYASLARKNFVLKRTALELVELMKQNSSTDLEGKGRISGSLAWRLLRGETTEENSNFTPYTWKLNDVGKDGKFELLYITSKDVYIRNSEIVMDKWINGVYQSKSVFRNNEKDWKMTYLATKEGAEKGLISWKFTAEDKLFIKTVDLSLVCQTYESGVVSCRLCSDEACVLVPTDNKPFTTNAFMGSKSIELTVELVGVNFWQHAQILRQPINSNDSTFRIVITLGEG